MEVNSKMEDNEPSDSINASVYLYLKIISKDIAKQFKKHVGLHHVPENTIKLQSLKKFRKRKNKEAANTSNVDDNDDTINDSVQEKADEVPVVNGDSSSPSKTKKRKKKAKTTVVQENSTEKVIFSLALLLAQCEIERLKKDNLIMAIIICDLK